MPQSRPKVGCCILSLKILNTDIHNLYFNSAKVKAAYFNGEKVFTQKHLVRWFDSLGNLLKTEWVTDGESATPPNVTEFSTDFYGYNVSGWNNAYDAITGDIDISVTATIETAYLFRAGFGVNAAEIEDGFSASATAYDNTSSKSYTSVARGSVSDNEIKCSCTGSTNSGRVAFRIMRYCAVLLDVDALRAAGYTSINFDGAYSFGAGKIYGSSLRSAFVSLQASSKITTTTAAGVTNALAFEKMITKAVSAKTAVAETSGNISSTLQLPETGKHYLIIGCLSKGFSGAATIKINNIWLE